MAGEERGAPQGGYGEAQITGYLKKFKIWNLPDAG